MDLSIIPSGDNIEKRREESWPTVREVNIGDLTNRVTAAPSLLA